MRFNRARVAGAALAGLALLASACGSSGGGSKASSAGKPSITIGAFNFSESAILANIYAGALKNLGYKVTVRANLGSREVVEPALEKGDIDMYAGYAATELEFLNKGKGEATPDPAATTAKLRQTFQPKGISVLDPSPATDANGFAVTRKTADQYKLTKLSDVAPVAGQMTLGGPPECPTRPFCQPGLERVYGLKFKSFKPLDAGGPLSKTALKNGDVDMALIFTSDGAIKANDFVLLQDDKKLQNADNVVPVVKADKATPEVTQVLNSVSAKLTTADLTALNKSADIDKEDPDALAQKWLKDNGFTKK